MGALDNIGRARTLAHETDDDVLYAEVVNADRTRLLAEAIERGLAKNRVSWARLYRDIAQKIGRKFEVDAEVMHRLGVSLPVAQTAVRAMLSASEDEGEVYAQALAFVEQYERRRGRKVLVVPFAEAGDGPA